MSNDWIKLGVSNESNDWNSLKTPFTLCRINFIHIKLIRIDLHLHCAAQCVPHKFCPLCSPVYTVPDNCSHVTQIMHRTPKTKSSLGNKTTSNFPPSVKRLFIVSSESSASLSDEVRRYFQSKLGKVGFDNSFFETKRR